MLFRKFWKKDESDKKIDESTKRTRESFFGKISGIFDRRELDESVWEALEELMIQADVGVETTDKLIERTKERVKKQKIHAPEEARKALEEEMVRILTVDGRADELRDDRLNVILVIGVNGTGKTTSIAKLAKYFQEQGQKVILAAADTFRAAAIDQLRIWGERVGTPVIGHQPGADPGAVVYDGFQAAKSRNANVLIVDTAGRLHTKFNLMEELKKVRRVLEKQDPTAPHLVFLVVDATTGQNALIQAKHFSDAIGVSGIVLAKLDGTAKGGIAFAIADQLRIPIRFVGTGEKVEDLAEFDPAVFVGSLFR